jgi:sugar phosphate isomerase/epimerase
MLAQEMPLGVVVGGRDPLRALEIASSLGFPTCQLYAPPAPQRTPDTARLIREEAQRIEIKITSVICAFPNEDYSSTSAVARTVGLAPPATRDARFREILSIADFARELGVDTVQGHIGFLPEEPRRAGEIVDLVKRIADYLAQRGQSFAFETGQEPGQALRRFIKAVGRDNLRVNFDPANFVLYGSDDPLHALDVLGDFIIGFHCKDGLPPEEEGKLGREVPLGKGKVDFPKLLAKLNDLGYSGPLTIEREFVDEAQQEQDVAHARDYLHQLMTEI